MGLHVVLPVTISRPDPSPQVDLSPIAGVWDCVVPSWAVRLLSHKVISAFNQHWGHHDLCLSLHRPEHGPAQHSPSCSGVWKVNSRKGKHSTAGRRIIFLFPLGTEHFHWVSFTKNSPESLLNDAVMTCHRISSPPSKTSAFWLVLNTVWHSATCFWGTSLCLCSLQVSLAPVWCGATASGSWSDGLCSSDPWSVARFLHFS